MTFEYCKARVKRELSTANNEWLQEKTLHVHASVDRRDSNNLYIKLREVNEPPSSDFVPLRKVIPTMKT